MNPIDPQKIEDIFNAAIELPEDQRPHFLSVECGDDVGLRRELESLLANYKPDFMEKDVRAETLKLSYGKLIPGRIINDKYEIIDMIGEGGMGEVYSAADLKAAGMKVALKVLKNYDSGAGGLQRFKKETEFLAKLNHPNILTVYTADNDEEIYYIVTEFFEGETLRQKLQSPLDLSTTIKITLQIASALEEAHRIGINHRDIKPENVMINKDNQVKLLDFGIAGLTGREALNSENTDKVLSQTHTASNLGTINYVPPEQLSGEDIDTRSDIWSLGVCLYEMVTGAKPFSGKTPMLTFAAILKDEPAPLGQNIPIDLKKIINKALKKDPDKRYQTISDFYQELDEFQNQSKKVLMNFNQGMNTFGEWIKHSGKFFSYSLFGLYGFNLILTVSLSSAFYIWMENEWKDYSRSTAIAIGSFFHLIIILLSYTYYRRHPGVQKFPPVENDHYKNKRLKEHVVKSTGYKDLEDWKTARTIAKFALDDYRRNWKLLLIVWFGLYSILFLNSPKLVKLIYPHLEALDRFDKDLIKYILKMLIDGVNNLNTLFILFLFSTLNKVIATENKSRNKDKPNIDEEIGDEKISKISWSLIAGLFGIEVLLLIILGPSSAHSPQIFIGLLSGILGGVAMSLYIGRFQSKFLKTPLPLLAILYTYTVIQTLFIFFGDHIPDSQFWTAVVIHTALFLKCLLILFMSWLFQSGRLLFYLVRVKRADEQVDKEWNNFYEVVKEEVLK